MIRDGTDGQDRQNHATWMERAVYNIIVYEFGTGIHVWPAPYTLYCLLQSKYIYNLISCIRLVDRCVIDYIRGNKSKPFLIPTTSVPYCAAQPD